MSNLLFITIIILLTIGPKGAANKYEISTIAHPTSNLIAINVEEVRLTPIGQQCELGMVPTYGHAHSTGIEYLTKATNLTNNRIRDGPGFQYNKKPYCMSMYMVGKI
jgi:hypothetical protein